MLLCAVSHGEKVALYLGYIDYCREQECNMHHICFSDLGCDLFVMLGLVRTSDNER